MQVYEAILKRQSIRAFLSKEIPAELLRRLLDAARHAPSGANTQPWQVAVVTGQKKQELQQRITQAFAAGEASVKDYAYYPENWQLPYKNRRTDCGRQLYDALHIERQDHERRKEQWIANYRSFDAPVMLIFFIHQSLATGSYLDYGMFLQSLMLAAVAEGLGTCPQAALGEYPAIVREVLVYDATWLVLCGMALGYPDTEAAVNSYRTPREEVAAFTQFFT